MLRPMQTNNFAKLQCIATIMPSDWQVMVIHMEASLAMATDTFKAARMVILMEPILTDRTDTHMEGNPATAMDLQISLR